MKSENLEKCSPTYRNVLTEYFDQIDLDEKKNVLCMLSIQMEDNLILIALSLQKVPTFGKYSFLEHTIINCYIFELCYTFLVHMPIFSVLHVPSNIISKSVTWIARNKLQGSASTLSSISCYDLPVHVARSFTQTTTWNLNISSK